MNTEYRIKLTHQGNYQTLQLPPELFLLGEEAIVRKEGEKLILEPYSRPSLLETLATLDDLEEDFPDFDKGLLPLDEIEF